MFLKQMREHFFSLFWSQCQRHECASTLLLLAVMSFRATGHVPGYPHGPEMVMLSDDIRDEMVGKWSTDNRYLPEVTVVSTARNHSRVTLYEEDHYMLEDQRAVLYFDSTAWTRNPAWGLLSRWRWLNLLVNQVTFVLLGMRDAAANLNAGDDTLPAVIYKDAFVTFPIVASQISHFSYIFIETMARLPSLLYLLNWFPTMECYCVCELKMNASHFVIERRRYTGQLEYTAWKERAN
jgi:hypothetical protein